jgi:hypothetical protein
VLQRNAFVFVVPRCALHFGLRQQGIDSSRLFTQGSQQRSTLRYSHTVPPDARHSLGSLHSGNESLAPGIVKGHGFSEA